jgi:cell division protein FtsI (penicillin-binding protein 3)
LGFLGLIYTVLICRAIQVHVVDRATYLERGDENIDASMVFKIRRGDITGRRGEILATSLKAWTLVTNPRKVESPAATAALLSPIINMSRSRLEQLLNQDKPYQALAFQLSDETYAVIRSLQLQEETKDLLRGVRMDRGYKRYYPKQGVAGHILGWTNQYNEGYTGLELGLDEQFESEMRGGESHVQALRTGLRRKQGGSTLALLDKVFPLVKSGAFRVETTIDTLLQEKVERILAETVKRNLAKRGTAVVIDVKTGEILAFAHAPLIDNNRWRQQPSRNRQPWGIKTGFEPGSVLKVMTVAAALEAGIVEPDTVIDTHNGRFRVADKEFRELKRLKEATVRDVLRYSSNIGTVEIAMMLGQPGLRSILKRAGFGQKTGLPIPGETAGVAHLNESTWDPVSFATRSFGQGIQVSAIQVVRAFAAFGNDGVLLEPHLIKRVRDHDGRIVYEAEATPINRIVSPETAATVRELLIDVTTGDATGQKAALKDCRVGGKTGTGQQWVVIDSETGKEGYSSEAEVASFAGLVPGDRPKVAIYVVIDRPIGEQGGGAVAAPAFREIADAALDILGARPCAAIHRKRLRFRHHVPRSVPVHKGDPNPSLASAPVPGTIIVPNLRGKTLAGAMETLGEQQLGTVISGSGIVQNQAPGPGTVVAAGTPIQINCALQKVQGHAVD